MSGQLSISGAVVLRQSDTLENAKSDTACVNVAPGAAFGGVRASRDDAGSMIRTFFKADLSTCQAQEMQSSCQLSAVSSQYGTCDGVWIGPTIRIFAPGRRKIPLSPSTTAPSE